MNQDFARRLRAFHRPDSARAELPKVDVADGVATLRLYDPIDSWGEFFGTSAKEFAAALDTLPANVHEIRLHLNSPGGEVFEGIAILNALRNHDAKVVAIVDGIAASAASFIACGADELVMARNSELMIHDAWGLCVGNAADMHAMADMLDHISDNIASIYADKAGGTVEEWRAVMAGEAWYSATEAVDAGLADRVDDRKADEAKNRFDLSIFTYAGRQAAPAPTRPVIADEEPPVAEAPTYPVRVNEFRHLVATTRT
jgi:ATP-dependent Clp endopeptidase proteolytic subunit ClpP